MRRLFITLTVCLATTTIILARDTPSPRKLVDAHNGDKRLDGFRVQEGLKVEIAAAAPTVSNPICLAFLDDGTAVVVDRTKLADGSTKDVLKALSSSKKNGIWDRARVLLESDSIPDVLAYQGWLYLGGERGLRRFKPVKEGEPSETPADLSPIGTSFLTAGPDGSLYFCPKSGGAVYRSRMDGTGLEKFADGLAGAGTIAFDPGGNPFLNDGRLVPLVEGGDYTRLPPIKTLNSGSPGGLLVVGDTLHLPEEYRGLLLFPSAARRAVIACKLEAAGASFQVAEEFVLFEAAKTSGFIPSRMTQGRDGAVYVLGDRIYRLTGAKPLTREAGSRAAVASLKVDELVAALSGGDASDREQARRELVRRGDKTRPALLRLLGNDDTTTGGQLAAMGALQAMVNDEVLIAFARTLTECDGDAARLAADLLGRCAKQGDPRATNALIKSLATEDRNVRRSAALALGRVGGDGAADALAAALSFDDGSDVFLRDGLARGLERLGKPGIDALLSRASSGVQKESDRVAEVFLTFRTRPAFDALVKLLQNPHLSETQKANLVRSAGDYKLHPPASLDEILAHVVGNEKESPSVRKAMRQALESPRVARTTKGDAFLKEAKRADESRKR